MCLSEYLTSIADALRRKKGTNDKINAQDFVKEIDDLSGIKGVSLDDGENIVVEVEDQTIILKGDINTYKIEANDSWVDVSEATGPIEITADAHPSVIINSDSGSIKLNLIDATVDLSDCSSEVAIVDKFNKTHTVYYNDVELGPDMEGGSTVNLYVPQVTDIELSEDGILSWKAPSISIPTEYNSSISYLVNVNGTNFEVSETSKNVFEHLVGGDNNISIIVKVRLHEYSDTNNVVVQYSLPSYSIIPLTTTILTPRSHVASAVVGNKIYTFGGQTGTGYDASSSNFINIFNAETEQLEGPNSNTPELIFDACAASVGTNIYVFGGFLHRGLKTTANVFKYNTVDNTITNACCTIPDGGVGGATCAAVGTDIYIFCGHCSPDGISIKSLNSIFKFDTLSEEITKLDATVLYKSGRGVRCVAVGTDIYIFGGDMMANTSMDIVKFDTVNQTIEEVAVDLPSRMSTPSVAAIGNNIYIFSGDTPNADKTIYKLNVLNGTIETLELELPEVLEDATAQSVGKNIYIFGGTNADVPTSEILKFTAN